MSFHSRAAIPANYGSSKPRRHSPLLSPKGLRSEEWNPQEHGERHVGELIQCACRDVLIPAYILNSNPRDQSEKNPYGGLQ